jgi:hypothetical protein
MNGPLWSAVITDNSVVPEPGTLSLLLVGGMASWLFRRRRQR